HLFARQEHGMRTIIPATRGRPTKKLPKGYWRRLMTTRLNSEKYGQRWQVETVNSMIKRMQGSALRARSYWSQCREIVLRTITHNIMIL
ncbi:transposase, partial [Gimesia sp.]|uniref:transposase n=1 Tax=Gimesia sp. TaxID=2024833 RepID=UPI003A90BB7A